MANTTYQRVIFPERGRVELEEAKIGSLGPHDILIETRCTLISAGTELMGLLKGERFPARPGYSNAGVVLEVGAEVTGVSPGDRVVSQGGHGHRVVVRYSPHTVQKIPDTVSDEQATFTVLASVALHGVRTGAVALDESVFILGQGIVGQLVLQLVRLTGGRPVVVADFYDTRLSISIANGALHALNAAAATFQDDVQNILPKGAAVIFDCTASPKGIPSAVDLAEQHGRIIGVTSLREDVVLPFRPFQQKELSLISIHQPQTPEVETAYYPWTKERHRTYLLNLMAEGKLQVDSLINLKMPGAKAPEAYAALQKDPANSLGALLVWNTAF